LNGAFYRVGPDPQYTLLPRNIPFDGEGHVCMFRISNGRVDYRSRMVRTERYVAQDKARRILFPMYRNPSLDDPSVKALSRGTANTHVINHKNYLLALKEMYPHVGGLPRQDDRYNTEPYRYGFLPCPDPDAAPAPGAPAMRASIIRTAPTRCTTRARRPRCSSAASRRALRMRRKARAIYWASRVATTKAGARTS